MWSLGVAARFKEYEYAGLVYAINKGGLAAHGFPGFTSCCAIGAAVELAYLMVPLEATLEALADVAAAGIKSVIVLTSGFSEAGAAGAELQAHMIRFADLHQITLLGPNSLGFANVAKRLVSTIVPARLPLIDGAIGLVSQSGAVLSEITKFAHQQGIGLSFLAATGNEAQVDLADIVGYLVDDAATRVIAVFAESIRNSAKLQAAAVKALQAKKPIVILKVGKSAITAQVAQAHTGSLVGDDKVFDAACLQLGLIRVGCIEELMLTAKLLENLGPLSVPGVAVVSISGGGCGLFADRAEENKVALPAFSAATVSALRAVLPELATTLNPLDITGSAIRSPELWQQVLSIVNRDPAIGLTVVINPVPAIESEMRGQLEQSRAIGRAMKESPIPGLMLMQSLQPLTDTMRRFSTDTALPPIAFGIDYSVRALGKLAWWSALLEKFHTQEKQPVAPVPAAGAQPRSERAVLEFLDQCGVPVIPAIIAGTAAQAIAHAALLNCPVALKVASADIAHKTEAGGVKLGVSGAADVGAAFAAIDASVRRHSPQARIDGIIVAPMRNQGIELFVGTARDPQWGPVLALGLGGIWVEALADTAVRLLPVSAGDVIEMLQGLRAAKILQGFRGAPAVDMAALADVIVKIGQAALALGPELAALEVNPLLVADGRIEALDGLAIWNEPAATSSNLA